MSSYGKQEHGLIARAEHEARKTAPATIAVDLTTEDLLILRVSMAHVDTTSPKEGDLYNRLVAATERLRKAGG